ncbi:MAG: hypothetical protein PSN34_11605 [Urechidicola sp.]|nr:hypothetical protein [Urechidicola sp.]
MGLGLGISFLHDAKKIRDDRSRNKTLQKKRIDKYRNLKNTKGEFNFPKVSEEELAKIKSDIRLEGKKQRRKEFLIISIVSIVVISVVLLLFQIHYMIKNNLI